MIPLTQVSVPTPCDRPWDGMSGDAQARFCASCRHHVHDLSAMSRAEAQELLDRTDGRLCVRFVPDANGAPLTLDDLPAPVRRPSWTRRWAAAAAWAVAVLVSGLGGVQAAVTAKHSAAKTTKAGHAQTKAKPKPPTKPHVAPRPHRATTMGIMAPLSTAPAPPPAPAHTMGKVAPPKH